MNASDKRSSLLRQAGWYGTIFLSHLAWSAQALGGLYSRNMKPNEGKGYKNFLSIYLLGTK
jgi:hypothetical protein